MPERKGNGRGLCRLHLLSCLWVLAAGWALDANAADVYVPDNYPSIQAAINAVAAGDTIHVRAGTYKEHLWISKPLTLSSVEGSSATIIDGRGTGRPLMILHASDVAVIGFRMQNGGHAENGGGVYIESSTGVTLEGNAIAGNSAGQTYGGGIYAIQAEVLLKSNLIENNSAAIGGGIYLESCSGSITGNNLSGNSAADWGGGMGAIESPGMLFTNNTITGNTAQNGIAGLSMERCDRTTLRKNTFSNNTSQGSYAGLYMRDCSSVVLDGNTFSGNRAAGAYGAAFFRHVGLKKFTNNTVRDNVATESVGGLAFEEGCSGVLSGNRISGNQANEQAAIRVFHSNMQFLQNEILDNVSDSYDIFWVEDCPGGVFRGNTISRNTCKKGGGSGLILSNSSSVVVDGNTFSGNHAAGWNGAAIFHRVDLQFTNNTVQDNVASEGVGGLAFENRCSGIVSGNTISGNRATSQAAIRVYLSEMQFLQNGIFDNVSDSYEIFRLEVCPRAVIRGNTISRNTCKDGGGSGIAIHDSSAVRVEKNLISFNTATGGGAGIYAGGTDLTLRDNLILNNQGNSHGGGIELWSCTGAIHGNSVIGNTCENGGGLWIATGFYMTVDGNLVKSNTASDTAGGIFVWQSSALSLEKNIVSYNTAANGAGGIQIYESDAVVASNLIQHNTTDGWTGGINADYSTVDLFNNIVSDNHAKGTDNGGGVTVWGYSSARLINNTIVNNSIPENPNGEGAGGVSCGYNGQAEVINTIVWGNSPNQMRTRDNSTLEASTCNIQGSYPGTGNIHAAPRFTGPGDFHLVQSSPGIDKGAAEDAPAKDIDGQARPQGAKVDIGADEYRDGTVSIVALSPDVVEAATAPASFLISRTDADTENPLSVTYSIGGTARPGVDYQPLSGSITIPAKKRFVLLDIEPIDNTKKEGDRTVAISLSKGGYAIGFPGADLVSIRDDEP